MMEKQNIITESVGSKQKRERFRRTSIGTQIINSNIKPKKRVQIEDAGDNTSMKIVNFNDLQAIQDKNQRQLPERFNHPKYNQEYIDQMRKAGFKELSDFITKNKGGLPAFGYPLMAFDEYEMMTSVEKAKVMWEFLHESVMNNAGQQFDSKSDEKKRVSLLINFLLKYELQKEDEQNILKAFTYGSKTQMKGNQLLQSLNKTLIQTFNTSIANESSDKADAAEMDQIGGQQNNHEEGVQFRRSLLDLQNQVSPDQSYLAKLIHLDAKSDFKQEPINNETNNQRKSFLKVKSKNEKSELQNFINRLKMRKQLSRLKMTEILSNQYRVFRITPSGQEEIDFKEWASDPNRNHPIAKAFQSLQKKAFESKSKHTSPLSSPRKLEKIDFLHSDSSCQSLQKKRSASVKNKRAKNKVLNNQTFTIRVENVSKLSKHDDGSPQFKTILNSRHQRNTSKLSDSKQTSGVRQKICKTPNRMRAIDSSAINNKFDNLFSNHRQLVSQLRKHVTLVQKANEISDKYKLQKKSNINTITTDDQTNQTFSKQQQTEDVGFMQKDQMINRDDLFQKENKQRCQTKNRNSRIFTQSELKPQQIIKVKRPQTAIKVRNTSNKRQNKVVIHESFHNQSENKTIEPDDHSIQLINKFLLQKELAYRHKIIKDFNEGGNGEKSLHPNKSDKKDDIEPEKLPTGYIQAQIQNEGSILMKTTKSANKINIFKGKIDTQLHRERVQQANQKYRMLASKIKYSQEELLDENNPHQASETK